MCGSTTASFLFFEIKLAFVCWTAHMNCEWSIWTHIWTKPRRGYDNHGNRVKSDVQRECGSRMWFQTQMSWRAEDSDPGLIQTQSCVLINQSPWIQQLLCCLCSWRRVLVSQSFLPTAHSAAARRGNCIMFSEFLFCGWVFSKHFYHRQKNWALVWLGVFQLFCVIKISGNIKVFRRK